MELRRHLGLLVVTDDDNGCVDPETRDGDVTCDEDGGELSSWLRVAIADEAGAQL